MIPYFYLRPGTFEIIHSAYNTDKRWIILAPAYDGNLEICSKYNEENK